MLRKFLFLLGLAITVLATMNVASRASNVIGVTPDNLVLVPATLFHHSLNCEEARSFLEKQGYHLVHAVRCGGNYHIFRAERRGFYYVLRVLTERGQMMIDDRIR